MRSGGWSLAPPGDTRGRPASNPYQGHWNLFTTFRGLAGAGGGAATVTAGCVNSTLGCETLPGAWVRITAAAPPNAANTTAPATSPRRSSRRETGLDMTRMLMGPNRGRAAGRAKMTGVNTPSADALLALIRALPAAGPLLAAVGETADVYLVGGAVRDVLLEGQPLDLDLVVE